MARISAQQLSYLRNEIPLAHVIQDILLESREFD